MASKRLSRAAPYFPVLPALGVVFGLLLFPMLYSVNISFQHYNLLQPTQTGFVGLKNYELLFQDTMVSAALVNTAVLAVGLVALTEMIGLGLALVLNERFRGRGLAVSLLLIPWGIPDIANGIMWRWMLLPQVGAINSILMQLHLWNASINFLADPDIAMLSIILASSVKIVPLTTLFLLAGLQAIPPAIDESAKIDGATAVQRFHFMAIPFLRPILAITLILNTMIALKVFDVIYVLTEGGPGTSTLTLSYYAYRVSFQFLNFGYGAAIAWLVSALVIVTIILYFRAVYREIGFR